MSGGARFAAEALGAWALALAIAPLGCGGPRPELGEHAVRVGSGGQAWVVVSVRNAGGGEGTVEVRAALRDGAGRVVGKGRESVELAPHEVAHVTVEVQLDPGLEAAAATDLSVSLDAAYPPG